jgi:hypothetical protein
MSGVTRAGLLAAAAMTAALVAACSQASNEDAETAAQNYDERTIANVDDLEELNTILGDDRVATTLRANHTTIPNNLAGFEAMFKVGRECQRADSKEIFVIEEKSTRITGAQEEATDLLPRLVIGGCNKTPQVPGSMINTFELFLAIVSDKARPIDDPLSLAPNVEAMALDTKTGLYNFYVIETSLVPNKPGTVTRFIRKADNTVEKWQKVSGHVATKEVSTDRKCYNCHIHGGPVMNELTEPWSNWVSSHKSFSRALTGDSKSLVSEARPFGTEHTRSSLANQLEQVIRASMQAWVEGVPGRANSGLGPQVLAGEQPGGVQSLLKSVFCETEVNYVSTHDTVPVGLFVDVTASQIGLLEPPIKPADYPSMTLLPVRAEGDIRIERFLQKAGVLRPDTVLAVRVVDDEHAVFSKQRCDLHSSVVSRIGGGTKPDDAVRAVINEMLTAEDTQAASGGTTAHSAAQRAYMRALLDPTVDPLVRDSKQEAYVTELTTRYNAEIAKLDTQAGRETLTTRWYDRQASARAMFPDAKNPLPITHAPN